jgi:hypothetical protein
MIRGVDIVVPSVGIAVNIDRIPSGERVRVKAVDTEDTSRIEDDRADVVESNGSRLSEVDGFCDGQHEVRYFCGLLNLLNRIDHS